MPIQRNALIGSLFVMLSAAGYACLPIFIRSLYEAESDITPIDIATWRFIMAVGLVWVIAIVNGQIAPIRALSRPQILLLLGLGGLFSMANLMAAVALERVPASTYTLILYTYPAMVALLSFALGERLGLTRWGAVGLALIGCAFTISSPIEVKSPLDFALPLINAAPYAVYLVIAGRYNRVSGLPASAVSMSGTLLVMLPLGLLSGLYLPTSTEGWLYLLGLGVVSTVFPILLMFAGIARIGAASAAILSTIEPLVTIVLAAALLEEAILPMQWVGGALIIVSVLLLHLPTGAPREPHPEVETLMP